jgi:hypothetical protein
VGGGLGGRLVVAAWVVALVGGTSGGLAIVDGGGLTNGLGRVGNTKLGTSNSQSVVVESLVARGTV